MNLGHSHCGHGDNSPATMCLLTLNTAETARGAERAAHGSPPGRGTPGQPHCPLQTTRFRMQATGRELALRADVLVPSRQANKEPASYKDAAFDRKCPHQEAAGGPAASGVRGQSAERHQLSGPPDASKPHSGRPAKTGCTSPSALELMARAENSLPGCPHPSRPESGTALSTEGPRVREDAAGRAQAHARLLPLPAPQA